MTGRPLEIEILCRLHNYFAFEPSCFEDKKCQHSTLVNPDAVGRDSGLRQPQVLLCNFYFFG